MRPRKSFPFPDARHAGLHILETARPLAADAEIPERLQAAGLAHDLNNLLGVILGCCEELTAQGALPAPVLARIVEINRAACAGKKLASGVLASSTGSSSLPETVDLNECVLRMGSVLVRMLGERIKWEQHLGAGLGLVALQPGHLEQILINLVLNARDAMPQGGTLSVETSSAYLDDVYARDHSGVRAGSYLRLSIRDTGCGMDGETQARVFEPFFTTKGGGRGRGLGLATVASIIQNCGGHIRVSSRLGWGTTFDVHFQRFPQPANPPAPATNVSLASGVGTILLAEDSPSLRGLTRRILERAGYAVLDAGASEDALALARSVTAPIHLLLTDVAMPGMNGIELAQKLTAFRPETTVLFMSGHCEQTKRPHGMYLGKPFSREMLLAMVHDAMTRSKKPAGQLACDGAPCKPRFWA